MRLIDADALCDKIDNEMQEYDAYDSCQAKIVSGLLGAEKLVWEMPTIEAEPVKHGRWVYDENNMEYSCSECLHEAHVTVNRVYTYLLTDYCPNCGAKMQGGKDE